MLVPGSGSASSGSASSAGCCLTSRSMRCRFLPGSRRGSLLYHSGAGCRRHTGRLLCRRRLARARPGRICRRPLTPRSRHYRLLFAAPATVAGYHATLGVAHIGVPSEAWREVFAVIGAVVAGITAWVRMTVFAEPSLGQGETAGPGLIPAGRAISRG